MNILNRDRSLITLLVLPFLNNFLRLYFQILIFAELLYQSSILFFSNFGIWIRLDCISFFLQKVYHRGYSNVQISCYFIQSYSHNSSQFLEFGKNISVTDKQADENETLILICLLQASAIPQTLLLKFSGHHPPYFLPSPLSQ